MTSKIQLQVFCPSLDYEEEKCFKTVSTQHMQRNNRKNSQESVDTKTSEKSDSLEMDLIWCDHFSPGDERICDNCGVFFVKETNWQGVKTNRFFGASWNIPSLR